MSQTLLIPINSVYLVDTCSFLDLDSAHPMQPGTEFSIMERALIWEGLENLADSGQLKLITQVKKELKRHHPTALKRLIGYPGHRLVVRRTPALIAHYQAVTTAYPQLVRGGRLKRDKADPWLITIAEIRGYEIVSDELRISERSSKQRKILKIPDVCDMRGIKCHKLRELATQLGWL
jgi:uncharacterized protein DUF4411